MPRGRPKGSKNKVKTTVTENTPVLIDNEKNIKKQIRALRKLKKEIPVKTIQRREINKQIRDLRKQLTRFDVTSSEKDELIKQIYMINPDLKRININLNKYTIDQLKYHLNRKRR